jgi:adenylate kinase family enzyme
MRLYFIGSHSTGKTTLCRYVSQNYNLPFINEMARTVLSEKELSFDTLRTDLNTVDVYQEEVIMRQMIEETKHKSFVSDRCFDGLAYAAQHARILQKVISKDIIKEYIAKLREPDVFLFFVRPSLATMKQDGVRETLHWDGVIAIDAMVKLLLEMWGLDYFQISMDNMQERVRFVDSILKKYQNIKAV